MSLILFNRHLLLVFCTKNLYKGINLGMINFGKEFTPPVRFNVAVTFVYLLLNLAQELKVIHKCKRYECGDASLWCATAEPPES